MNGYLAVAALVGFVGLMLLLPVVPALVELRRKSDALPLSVVQQNAGEIRHFANSFRAYINQLGPTLQHCVDSGTTASGTLPDGSQYFVLGRSDETPMFLVERNSICHFVIVAGAGITLPGELTFSNDVYSGGRFIGGEKNNYRAILGEKDVHLAGSSRVMRWVHAGGDINADAGCQLYGRASSDSILRLHRDCSFARLNAPRIEIGRVEVEEPVGAESDLVGSMDLVVPQRFLYDGDFAIAAGEVIRGNLVVRGNLRMGAGARVSGSVKSGKDMVLEAGGCVEGSVISGDKMRIGSGCTLHGPVIAERAIHIAAGTRCGNLQRPTTVSAPRIEVEEGVVVFGTMWARESGQVATQG